MNPLMIIIVGNLSSGKTSLINNIRLDFPNADFFAIDEYRIKFGSKSWQSDKMCWEMLINDCRRRNFPIVECSGASKYFSDLKKSFKGEIITIKIDVPVDISIRRTNRRDNRLDSFFKFDVEDSVYYIAKKLREIDLDYVINGNQEKDKVVAEFRRIFPKDKL